VARRQATQIRRVVKEATVSKTNDQELAKVAGEESSSP
jgi:hypothetical protein